MTLAVMTRASLGHTGREIVADQWTMGSYCCVSTGAFLRVAADLAGPYQLLMLSAGGIVWSLAFLVFAIRYGPDPGASKALSKGGVDGTRIGHTTRTCR